MKHALLLLLIPAAIAQEPTPTFRSTTRLVEASVSVTDSNGRPVVGLSKADFTVTAGGRNRPIAFLQFDGVAGMKRDLKPLPRYVFTNRPEYTPAAARNVTAIVIDTLNSTVSDEVRLRAQLLRYLRTLPPDTRVALYQLSTSFRVLHDFTANPEDLCRRINSLSLNRLPNGENDFTSLQADARALAGVFGASAPQWQESMDRMLAAENWQAGRIKTDRLEAAFASMKALGRHLSSVPGRKNLIWAGGGLPLIQVIGELTAHDPHNRIIHYYNLIQETARRLAEANVVLYYFDTRGLVAPNHNPASQTPQYISDAVKLTEDARLGTSLLAKLTGGHYINYSNSVATAIETVEAEQRAGYTLAFYADDAASESWTPLAIKVNRAGIRLRHREGFQLAAESPDTKAQDQERLQAALRNPLGSTAILMNARCEPDSERGPGAVRLFVQVDAETLPLGGAGGKYAGSIEITVADVSAEGRVTPYTETAKLNVSTSDWPRTLREGIPYTRRWTPRFDAVRLRILVRSLDTGQSGALDIPLDGVFRAGL
ncbi:MAG: VWA domain-containing protein [Bryobacterales bacterium]|nr:VWA domain-containing protein [Bryobacterales bacterium]